MVFITRTGLMDHLEAKYGLERGTAAAVADFAHACGAYRIPGTQHVVQFMEGYGWYF